MTDDLQSAPSREIGFLIAAVRHFLNPGIAALPEPAGVNITEALRLAIVHSIVPIVYRTARETTTLDSLAAAFRPSFEEDTRFSLTLAGELCTIADLLTANQIRFVPLKGPLLSQRLYGDVATRSFADIDLLIDRGDVLRIRDLMTEAGYDVASPLHWNCDSACLRSREGELVMMHRTSGLTLDLHWRVVPWYFASVFDTTIVWNSLVTTRVAGRDLPDLSPEHLLLFLCAHGSKHAFERLSWICDIARCVEKIDLDWPEALAAARKSGSIRQLLLGLQVARSVLGARTPPDLPRDPKVDLLEQGIVRRLMHVGPLPTPGSELIPFCLELFESRGDKIRYLAGHLAPSDAEYRIVRLPPALHFLYYPFRPLRLALKMGLRGQE